MSQHAIGLILKAGRDRELVAHFLETQHYLPSSAVAEDGSFNTAIPFSLIVLDESAAPMLSALRQFKASQHRLIPILLLVHGDLRQAPSWLSAELVDDVIRLPISKWELAARMRVFLRFSAQSRVATEGLQRAAEQLTAADRVKDNFLAVVSHELRTPLSSILGWSQMLRSGLLSSEQHAEALETIERNARTQSKLIEDLLDVSRIISGKMQLKFEPVQLVLVVEQAVQIVRPAATAKGIRLETSYTAVDSTVLGDPTRLQQIVWNLVANAVKFTLSGGSVQVTVGRDGTETNIVISDTGPGISPELLPHIFEPFRQASGASTRVSSGLGLGLSIVHQLVQLHGGSVSVQSPVGQGTTFRIRVPLALAHRDDVASAPPLEWWQQTGDTYSELQGLRVLVVDDHAEIRLLLRTLLEQFKVQVTSAASAAEAFGLLTRERPDVLVSDIAMPDEDGYTLIRRIRQLPPEQGGTTPAIALTAFVGIEDRKQAFAAGFHSHLRKPIEPLELFAVLGSLSKRKTL